jgi:hypothetical protein
LPGAALSSLVSASTSRQEILYRGCSVSSIAAAAGLRETALPAESFPEAKTAFGAVDRGGEDRLGEPT